jgi:anti-sigma B factor antagonist
MKINFNNENGKLIVDVEGRLDTTTSPEFESFLRDNMDDIDEMTINCEKLEYISSAGLRVLLFAQKKMKDSMKLINVCDSVMEVFEITGFVDVLTIE